MYLLRLYCSSGSTGALPCTVVQALLGLYQGLAAQVRALGLRGVVLGTGMGIVIDMGMGMGMVIAVGMGKAC